MHRLGALYTTHTQAVMCSRPSDIVFPSRKPRQGLLQRPRGIDGKGGKLWSDGDFGPDHGAFGYRFSKRDVLGDGTVWDCRGRTRGGSRVRRTACPDVSRGYSRMFLTRFAVVRAVVRGAVSHELLGCSSSAVLEAGSRKLRPSQNRTRTRFCLAVLSHGGIHNSWLRRVKLLIRVWSQERRVAFGNDGCLSVCGVMYYSPQLLL